MNYVFLNLGRWRGKGAVCRQKWVQQQQLLFFLLINHMSTQTQKPAFVSSSDLVSSTNLIIITIIIVTIILTFLIQLSKSWFWFRNFCYCYWMQVDSISSNMQGGDNIYVTRAGLEDVQLIITFRGFGKKIKNSFSYVARDFQHHYLHACFHTLHSSP